MRMDKIRARVKAAIDARGLDYKKVSLDLGRNHAYMQQYVERGIPAQLKENDRAALSEMLDIPESELGAPASKRKLRAGDVPQFNIHAGMGGGGMLDVMVDEDGQAVDPRDSDGFWSFPESIRSGWRRIRQTYAMPVTGDSMEPTLPGGSYVFVDTSHQVPSPPDLYALDYGHGLMIKRVEMIPKTDLVRIISDNERYNDYELPGDQVTVYGRVVAWFQWRG